MWGQGLVEEAIFGLLILFWLCGPNWLIDRRLILIEDRRRRRASKGWLRLVSDVSCYSFLIKYKENHSRRWLLFDLLLLSIMEGQKWFFGLALCAAGLTFQWWNAFDIETITYAILHRKDRDFFIRFNITHSLLSYLSSDLGFLQDRHTLEFCFFALLPFLQLSFVLLQLRDFIRIFGPINQHSLLVFQTPLTSFSLIWLTLGIGHTLPHLPYYLGYFRADCFVIGFRDFLPSITIEDEKARNWMFGL